MIEDIGDDQLALTKLRKSVDLLNQRKSLLEIKNSLPLFENSEASQLSQAEGIKKELIELENLFTKEWGVKFDANDLPSALFSSGLQTSISEELLLEYQGKIDSLKMMKKASLELLDQADI